MTEPEYKQIQQKKEEVKKQIIALALSLHCGVDDRKDRIVIFLPEEGVV